MSRKISRREFLSELSKIGLGMMVAPGLLPVLNKNSFASSLSSSSLVVKVTDSNATSGFTTINPSVVQTMMDCGIKAFTGISDVGEAWKSIFPGITTSSVISIKANCIYPMLPSHPPVANAIVNSLRQMIVGGLNFPENNVIIWDNTNTNLSSSGYTINTGSTGIRCFGTNQSGVGYDSSATAVIGGVTVQFSKILSQMSNYLIDFPVVKDHGISGVTLSMKNFYGAINRPWDVHNNNCDPAIAQLNNTDLVKQKTKIVVVDALWGIYNGGPASGWTYYAFVPNSLYFATDRVAVDYILLQLINAERSARGLSPISMTGAARHIQTANDLGVGTNNPENITLVEITNPSRVEHWGKYS